MLSNYKNKVILKKHMEDESAAGDPSLDFLSPQFDPLKALSTNPSKILLPCPQVQPCDNLEVYKSGKIG